MDSFTQDHLAAWADHALRPEERSDVVSTIVSYVLRHPDVIDRGWSWSEIRDIAERNVRLGIAG